MAKASVVFSDGRKATIEADSRAEIEAAVLQYEKEITKAPKKDNADYAARLAGEVGQGASFGLVDELAGVVGAIPGAIATGDSIPTAYRGIRDAARRRSNEFRSEYPGTAITANLGGGLGSGLGLAKGAVGAAIANAPTMAGTFFGMLGGYGASDAETGGGLAKDTAIGGTVGMVLGRLAQPTANAVGEGVTAPLRYQQASNAGRPSRAVMKALERDQLTPEQVSARLAKMPQGAAIVDAGGENMQGLGESIINMPGSGANIGRRLFEQRRAAAPARVESLINQALQTNGKAAVRAQDALEKGMKAQAKPFYDAAFAKPVQTTPVLKGLMGRLKQSGIEKAARDKMRLDGQVTGSSIRFWDYAKREIDDRIGEALRAGRNNDVRILTDLKNTMVGEIDQQVPEYAQARAIYSGGARMRDALEAGRKFMANDAERIDDAIADFTPGELQMFRMGAARHLRDKMLSKPDGGDVAKSFFNSPLQREKIAALFTDRRQLATLARGMRSESKMAATAAKIAANSRTAPRLANMADVARDPEVQADAVQGGIKSAAFSALRKWWINNASAIRNEDVRTEVARIIFEGKTAEREALLRQIQQRPVMAPYAPGAVNSAAREAIPVMGGSAGAGVVGLTSNQASGRR